MKSFSIRDLNKDQLIHHESLFTTANGFYGVRGYLEEFQYPGSVRGNYLNGLYERIPMKHAEYAYGFPTMVDRMPNLLDPWSIDIWLEEEKLTLDFDLEEFVRTLYFDSGISERSYQVIVGEKKAAICLQRIADMVDKTKASFRVSIDYPGKIRLKNRISFDIYNAYDETDPRIASEQVKLIEMDSYRTQGRKTEFRLCTNNSKQQVYGIIQDNIDFEIKKSSNQCEYEYETNDHLIFERNLSMDIGKSVAYTSSFDEIKASNLIFFEEFWSRCDIIICGNDKLQDTIRFMIFQLLQSSGQNVAAKGLTGEGYEGHYFWDTEIYMAPVWALLDSSLSRPFIVYRHRTLPEAKQRALELGFSKGASFPWRTISGVECSGYFPAGTAQVHLNADIAYMVLTDYQIHRDDRFMFEGGFELLLETARCWPEIGERDQDNKFHIYGVTGPDEYTALVDDNTYTNLMVRSHLLGLYKVYQSMKKNNPKKMMECLESCQSSEREITDLYHLGLDIAIPPFGDSAIPQDSSFLKKPIWDFQNTPSEKHPLLLHYHPLWIYRHQVLKQADVLLACFLLPQEIPMSSVIASYDYYEPLTTHDSSLSYAIHSIIAGRIGRLQEADAFFEKSVYLDIDNLKQNTEHGLHMANIGGTLLILIYGYGGISYSDGRLHINSYPSQLFEGLNFTISFLNRIIRIERKRDQLRLSLIEGDPIELEVQNHIVRLEHHWEERYEGGII